MHPLILWNGLVCGCLAHCCPIGHERRAQPGGAGTRRDAVRCITPEVEDRSRRAGRKEQPRGHRDRVFVRQRLFRQLEVAAVTGQQQDPAWLWVLDERAAGAAKRRVELITRRVFRIAVEDVSSHEAGFTDAVEELVAPLLRLPGHAVRKRQEHGRDRQQKNNERARDHRPFHFVTPNVNTVCVRYSAPGRSVVVGNFGLFGESGKCCVSRQKPVRCL